MKLGPFTIIRDADLTRMVQDGSRPPGRAESHVQEREIASGAEEFTAAVAACREAGLMNPFKQGAE